MVICSGPADRQHQTGCEAIVGAKSMNGNAATNIQCIEFFYNQMLVDGIQWNLQAQMTQFCLQHALLKGHTEGSEGKDKQGHADAVATSNA